MTRGKYADRAEKTRAVATATTELERNRAALVRLSAELRETKEVLSKEREQHRIRVRQLNAQVQEGVSAELAASRAEVEVARNEAAEVRAETKRIKNTWHKLAGRMQSHLQAEGMTAAEAMETMLRWTGDFEGRDVPLVDIANSAREVTAERLAAIQRARGQRR